MLWLVFHQKLICGNDALHLSLVTAAIRVVAFGKCPVAALDLLPGRIWWQTQYSQCLLAF